MKIAVFVPSRPHFGNILTQLPFFCALKTEYPNAKIEVWSKFEQSKILLTVDTISSVINYKKFSFFHLVNELKASKYDAVYNLYSGSDKVHAAIKLSNIKQSFGHSSNTLHKYCYQHHLHINKGFQYIANSHLSLLNAVRGKNYTPNIIKSLIDTSIPKESLGLTLLPGGGAGDYKRWALKHYLATAEQIAIHYPELSVINWVLGPDEKHYEESIPSTISNIPTKIHHSPTISSLIELALSSKLSIANDCGPTHIFQMLTVPLITLWGWKSQEASPYNTMSEWFYSHENSWAIAPNEVDKCINSITVDKVSSLALAQLRR
ncbi:glycosyltransferase family 9 protein [Aliivibrio fischeri]|uniref:glycosyltransferase family 9 protein n=1 Tax=Aliivibrio fischeri TaxID=668 RepID=UPI0012D90A5B|nr:glycosyltransferase family 9 protein [Aliivibrio fischeri]MUK26547.1 lipopolysaccharide heptosyltransferase family protein [Aliivibrio fischeri]MUK33691.1 lipopolysaccharide heptosyltransferase family protein [Aliivibrio fischeri]